MVTSAKRSSDLTFQIPPKQTSPIQNFSIPGSPTRFFRPHYLSIQPFQTNDLRLCGICFHTNTSLDTFVCAPRWRPHGFPRRIYMTLAIALFILRNSLTPCLSSTFFYYVCVCVCVLTAEKKKEKKEVCLGGHGRGGCKMELWCDLCGRFIQL